MRLLKVIDTHKKGRTIPHLTDKILPYSLKIRKYMRTLSLNLNGVKYLQAKICIMLVARFFGF